MPRFAPVSLFFGVACLLGSCALSSFALSSFALGDDTQASAGTVDNGLASVKGTDRINSNQTGVSPSRPSAGSAGLPGIGNPFEDKKQQRQYEDILSRLRSMKLSSGGETSDDDWFVVGGIIGNQSNFNTFQGEEYVAQRIVEFVATNNNRCQWRVFSREENADVAKQMVSKVKTNYERWQQAEYNRALANYRARQIAASYQRAAAYQRSASSCRRPGGG